MTDLITKWRHALDSAKNIFTWTDPAELAWLAEQASRYSNVIEIGSYMGHSAKVMATACQGCVYAVDPFEVAGTRNVFEYFLRDELAKGKVRIVAKSSAEGAVELRSMLFFMVFIDDGHLSDDVERDIRSWLPLLQPGGLLCGHDYRVEHGQLNNVAQGVHRCLKPDVVQHPVMSIWSYRKP